MDRQPGHDTRTVRLAMLQARAEPLALTENLALVDASALEAREAGADLLLTPELFATGYAPTLIAESVSAASVAGAHESLRAIAANRGIALAFSLPGPGPADEREITATLVDNTGTVILGYAKSHLFGPAERSSFRPGAEAPRVAELLGLRMELLICYDVEFPETVRAAALRGAQVVLVPTALAAGYENVARVLVPARALENSLIVAYSNHVGVEDGLELAGASVVAGPDGNLLVDAGSASGLVYADLSVPDVDVDYLADRRPGLYRAWEQNRTTEET
ncbi:Predicted amidohydrolase [Cryobacterium psychrotolerans]|uniref:Predicted amidohydrolase n=1 Tax=Cryobacterium psychrotolerans TaxID=386301 RepID=A0A1G9AGJ2_9MICO|nr:nitrilase-related carbon-nitrogen hydrolase [Cryobacterium psychrotolerans]SDK25924.1 Predicted amidohydrolase [Cryobacterium psychrotolerans]